MAGYPLDPLSMARPLVAVLPLVFLPRLVPMTAQGARSSAPSEHKRMAKCEGAAGRPTQVVHP
jgi:hypothetical protein